MAATLRDVARLAGVSIKTVSNVIHDYPYIRAATRERVEAAIEELDYRPNLSARSLRSGRTGAIALAVPDLRLSYFAELADSVITTAERAGVVTLVEQTGGDRVRELELLHSPRRSMTDGLIFSALGMGPADADRLEVPYPLVLLGERIFDGPTDHVTMRNVEAARAGTEFLIRSGRRRIAIVGARADGEAGSSGLRIQGYREALAAHGIDPDDRLLVDARLWRMADGASAMRELLDRGVAFDGVFGLNDTLALGAMRVLQDAGLRVPEDVSVLGFDNLDEAAFSLPSLSSVDPGREWIARTAVETLLDRIAGSPGDSPPPRLRLADFEVVARESAPEMLPRSSEAPARGRAAAVPAD